LLGAATGCLGVLLLLHVTDGPTAMLWVAAIAAASAMLFASSDIGDTTLTQLPWASILRRPKWLCLVLTMGALVNGFTAHGLRPVAVKGKVESPTSTLLFEEWNSFSRVTAIRADRRRPCLWGPSPTTSYNKVVEQKFLTVELQIDGDAGTCMHRFDGHPEDVDFLRYDITNLAYYLRARQRSAVIGVGGGRDLLAAWTFGLRDITGVEINPIFIKLLTREPGYKDFANLHKLAGMHFVVDEARSWFARTDQAFDIIQMSLIDTWAATGAGAFTLSENGLYTVEAWRIFLGRLMPQGVFTVSRWYAPGNVNETGRMVSLAVASLMDMGVTAPHRHIFLAATRRIATLIVSRSPLSPTDIALLETVATQLEYTVLISPTARSTSDVLHNILTAHDRADLTRYTSSLALDLTPPTDNRPFFFNMLPFHRLGQVYREAVRGHFGRAGGVVRGNLVAAATLLILFMVSAGLVLATIILPLRSAIRDIGGRLVLGGTAYFLLIGIGFMAVEIGLLQRMSVFLGHPIYSLSVTLFTLILATGMGSLISDRFPLTTQPKFAVWAGLTGGYIVSLTLWLPAMLLTFDSAGLWWRAVLGVLTIAPAGLLLGFAFPTGMRLIGVVDRTPTPWFWGINGAAGVLAAILAVVTSITFGIHVTLTVGALCYFLLVPTVLLTGITWQSDSTVQHGLPVAKDKIQR
jgi:hypothetical protein